MLRSVNIYPNPTEDMIYINTQEILSICLTDIQGRQISYYERENGISLKHLSEGMYLLKVVNREGVIIALKKVIKK